jgi:hypothetical protein
VFGGIVECDSLSHGVWISLLIEGGGNGKPVSYHCGGLSKRDSNQFQAPLITIARNTFKLTQQTLAGERITEWARLTKRDIADDEQRLGVEEAKRCIVGLRSKYL